MRLSFVITGALVLKGNDILYEMKISKNNILEIIEIANKYNLHEICLEIGDKLYSNFDVTDYFGNVPCEIMDVRDLNFEKASKAIICTKGSINKEFIKELPDECRESLQMMGHCVKLCMQKFQNGIVFNMFYST